MSVERTADGFRKHSAEPIVVDAEIAADAVLVTVERGDVSLVISAPSQLIASGALEDVIGEVPDAVLEEIDRRVEA